MKKQCARIGLQRFRAFARRPGGLRWLMVSVFVCLCLLTLLPAWVVTIRIRHLRLHNQLLMTQYKQQYQLFLKRLYANQLQAHLRYKFSSEINKVSKSMDATEMATQLQQAVHHAGGELMFFKQKRLADIDKQKTMAAFSVEFIAAQNRLQAVMSHVLFLPLPLRMQKLNCDDRGVESGSGVHSYACLLELQLGNKEKVSA